MLFGYHEDVNRSFGIYVPERDGFVGFLNDCRRNLLGDNAAKQTIAYTSHWSPLLYQDFGEKMRRTKRSTKGIFFRKRKGIVRGSPISNNRAKAPPWVTK